MAELTDGQLVKRCRRGDEDAWRELVDRFSRYVWAIAVQGFRLSERDAEDVFQDVFARTHQHLHRLRDDGAIRAWIAQTTRRLAIDRIRRNSREHPTDALPEPADNDPTLERLAEAMDVRDCAGAPARPLPRDPRPLLCPRPELRGDRNKPRHPAGDDREPDLPVSGQAPAGPGAARGDHVVTTGDDERLIELLRALPPAPESAVARAKGLFGHLPSEGDVAADDDDVDHGGSEIAPSDSEPLPQDDDPLGYEPDASDDDPGESWT